MIRNHLLISPQDSVLEIGSGNNPHPKSQVLVDRYVHDNGQRAGKFSIVIDRPLIVADCYHLPFADKSFDYCICSHILEHMEEPEKFLKEVTRVAKRGYIEVPSIYAERLFGWDFHLWYCEPTKNGITLWKKNEGERFGGFYHRLIAQTSWFRRFFEREEDFFTIGYEWEGKPSVVVKHVVPASSMFHRIDSEIWNRLCTVYPSKILDALFYIQWMRGRAIRKSKKIVHLFVWKIRTLFVANKMYTDILPLLRCPSCRSAVTQVGVKHICVSCHAVYPYDGVVPVLLEANERKKGW